MSHPCSARRWQQEIILVFLLSLGQAAVYAVVKLADLYTRGPLSDATARLNTPVSPRPWFDLVYQLLDIGFTLVPAVLALWLMSQDAEARPVRQRLGLTFGKKDTARDLAWGLGMFAVIGVGTLGVYIAGRELGVTAQISTSSLGHYWWTVPVLILQAAKNGVLEEVLLLGYGFDRLEKVAWKPWTIIAVLAVVRASYHLYQGWGPFAGNILMGLIFGYLYLRTRRVGIFVLAHTLIDAVGFLGPGILTAVDPTV